MTTFQEKLAVFLIKAVLFVAFFALFGALTFAIFDAPWVGASTGALLSTGLILWANLR